MSFQFYAIQKVPLNIKSPVSKLLLQEIILLFYTIQFSQSRSITIREYEKRLRVCLLETAVGDSEDDLLLYAPLRVNSSIYERALSILGIPSEQPEYSLFRNESILRSRRINIVRLVVESFKKRRGTIIIILKSLPVDTFY